MHSHNRKVGCIQSNDKLHQNFYMHQNCLYFLHMKDWNQISSIFSHFRIQDTEGKFLLKQLDQFQSNRKLVSLKRNATKTGPFPDCTNVLHFKVGKVAELWQLCEHGVSPLTKPYMAWYLESQNWSCFGPHWIFPSFAIIWVICEYCSPKINKHETSKTLNFLSVLL